MWQEFHSFDVSKLEFIFNSSNVTFPADLRVLKDSLALKNKI